MFDLNLTDIITVLAIIHATYFTIGVLSLKLNISIIILGSLTQAIMCISVYDGNNAFAFIGVYLAAIHMRSVNLNLLNSFEGRSIFKLIYGRG
jgi:hypothetical protein